MRISSTKKCILGVIRNSKNYFLIAFEIFRFIKIAKKLTVKILQNLLSLSIEVKRNSMKILNSLNRQMHSCKFQCIGHTEIEIENLGIVKFLNQDFMGIFVKEYIFRFRTQFGQIFPPYFPIFYFKENIVKPHFSISLIYIFKK